MEFRTSQTHPLWIARLPTPMAGDIGLTFCPGKYDPSAMTGAWSRDLNVDLLAIRDWGATTLVTLMNSHELDLLRVPNLGEEARTMGLEWIHLPIRDASVPDGRFEVDWPKARDRLISALELGEAVVIHCKGGLGRTGLVAGMLLIEAGVPSAEVLTCVRAVRSGAVETEGQERYLLDYAG